MTNPMGESTVRSFQKPFEAPVCLLALADPNMKLFVGGWPNQEGKNIKCIGAKFLYKVSRIILPKELQLIAYW